jgi:uncharacterized membrane protein
VYRLFLFVHIAGLLGFVAAHGTSATVGVLVRRERDPKRIRALLEASAATRTVMYVSLLALAVGGVVDGFLGHWWGQAWMWLSVVLFVLMTAALLGMAIPHYGRLRRALDEATGDLTDAVGQIDRLLRSRVPLAILAVGTGGLLAILWLMVAKPR